FAFFVLPIVLFGGFAPPAAWQTSAVFFMFFVQSKHQQILHFDFESLSYHTVPTKRKKEK
ncbi:MAG: hypothetical protein SPJ90_05985, partial [Prevotella sp.]|nr:hypothetical protein [Prevotellaceae bacterium]MDY5843960.1 hypothetical protein [Prevotella sp.]